MQNTPTGSPKPRITVQKSGGEGQVITRVLRYCAVSIYGHTVAKVQKAEIRVSTVKSIAD